MPNFTYGTTTIPYTVYYKPDKTDLTISVDWKAGVSVVAPEGTGIDRISEALTHKARWMLRKLAGFREIQPVSTHHEFVSGEEFPYLGRQYRLKVVSEDNGSDASVTSATLDSLPPLLAHPACLACGTRHFDWYTSHGVAKSQQRIQLYAPPWTQTDECDGKGPASEWE